MALLSYAFHVSGWTNWGVSFTDLLCLLMLASGHPLTSSYSSFDFFFYHYILDTGGRGVASGILRYDLHAVRIMMSNTIWNLMYRSEEHAW